MVKYIGLTKGMVGVVDDEDYEHLVLIPWRYNNNGYAITARTAFPKAMHNYIMNPPSGMVVDHINRDRLDNRKENLRICTTQENSKNRSKRKNSISKYRGVTWHKFDKKWHVKIWVSNKNKHLGAYECEVEAAKAYDVAAEFHYGKYANLNFKGE